jgi:hypothetical protein
MRSSLLLFLLLLAGFARAQVGVGTITPDASAAMDITNSGKGLLVPRMTNAQRTAISSPATGLLVYQTDGTAGFYYNSGTSGSPSWTFIQNSGNANVTMQGNTFNGASQLVQLNASSQLPVASGVNLTSLNASNLGSGTVPTARLGTGTASSTTFLRGDGSWNTPSGGSGGTLDLAASNTASQSIAAIATATITFNTTTTSPTIGSFNGTTYTVGATGTYLIQIALMGTSNAAMSPAISVNGTAVRYGTGTNSSNYPTPFSRANLVAIIRLTAGDLVTIQGSNTNIAVSIPLTTDGSTQIAIVKM